MQVQARRPDKDSITLGKTSTKNPLSHTTNKIYYEHEKNRIR